MKLPTEIRIDITGVHKGEVSELISFMGISNIDNYQILRPDVVIHPRNMFEALEIMNYAQQNHWSWEVDLREDKQSYYERYRGLEVDLNNYFSSIKYSDGILLDTKEAIEDSQPNILTYVHSFSGENIDFYPLGIDRKGLIQGINTSFEAILDFQFDNLNLHSKIELIDLIKNKTL